MGNHHTDDAIRLADWSSTRDGLTQGVRSYLVYRLDGMPMARLAKGVSPYSTVQGYFYAWSRNRLFASMNHALVMQARKVTGREATLRQLLQQALPAGASS